MLQAQFLEQDNTLGQSHPVTFYSKSLQLAEQNYKIYNKELLAIIHALKHFYHYLQGSAHQTKIFLDHTNLKYFTMKQTLTHCQAQWSLFLGTFNYIIILLRAKDPKVQHAWVCITAAGLVLQEITGSKHWPLDVLV